MEKALDILQKPHHKSKFNNVTMVVYKEEQIKEVMADIEAMKPKTCDGCKLEGTVKNMTSMCMICNRGNKDYYEPKDNA